MLVVVCIVYVCCRLLSMCFCCCRVYIEVFRVCDVLLHVLYVYLGSSNEQRRAKTRSCTTLASTTKFRAWLKLRGEAKLKEKEKEQEAFLHIHI